MSKPDTTITWDDFLLIKAIAEAKGLQGAAAWLGINHSTVFRHLEKVEKGLGTTLFERHRSGYVLTSVGEEMVELAAHLDGSISGFTRKVAEGAILPAGELRVTTNDTVLSGILTPIFAEFRRGRPSLRLDVVIGNQALNLSRRDADVAIRATDNPPEALVGRRIARIAWALYGSGDDFCETNAPGIGDLANRSWVSLGETLATLKPARFVRQHVAPERIVYKIDTVLGLAEAIENGIGVGYLPCFVGDARPGLNRLAPPDPDFAADLWLLTHPDLRRSARVRVFLDFISAEIGKLRPLFEGDPDGLSAARASTVPPAEAPSIAGLSRLTAPAYPASDSACPPSV
jgi:DNA-binding transcriptional LysR family regulator